MRCASLPHLPAPVELKNSSEEEGSLPLGRGTAGEKRLIGIRPDDRLHQLVIGKSGMGKSTLLHTQIAADVVREGVGLVDPHGDLVDDGKIVLISLSQGKLGEPAARFAGSVLMAGFQNAAMTRADTHRTDRRPFFLYADEYATFVNSSFADTLAQARKYGLYLTAAQQIISQVDESIMDAMFGNLSTLVTFQVAQKDAERLSAELASDATPADLMRLPKYHAIVRTAVQGVPSRPFVVATLPPPVARGHHADPKTIRRVLSRRFRIPAEMCQPVP